MDGLVEQGEEVEQQFPATEESTVQRDEVLEIVRQIDMEVEPSSTAEVPKEVQAESIPMDAETVNEPTEEAEQPLLTPEEMAANLAAKNSEATEMDADAYGDRIDGRDSTERVEKATDETLETREEENLAERAGTSSAEGITTSTIATESREVVIITDEEETTEKVVPRDEVARTRAATVHIYQRRAAREEALGVTTATP